MSGRPSTKLLYVTEGGGRRTEACALSHANGAADDGGGGGGVATAAVAWRGGPPQRNRYRSGGRLLRAWVYGLEACVVETLHR